MNSDSQHEPIVTIGSRCRWRPFDHTHQSLNIVQLHDKMSFGPVSVSSAHGPAAATSAMAAQLVAAAEIHWSCPWGKPLSK